MSLAHTSKFDQQDAEHNDFAVLEGTQAGNSFKQLCQVSSLAASGDLMLGVSVMIQLGNHLLENGHYTKADRKYYFATKDVFLKEELWAGYTSSNMFGICNASTSSIRTCANDRLHGVALPAVQLSS